MGNLAAIDWHSTAIWFISLASIALVLARPKGWPEAIWAAAGASLLVICRLISPTTAASGVAKGADVYLFLAGMMILSELASREGVFDWAAGYAVRGSRGSRTRLFILIYVVGIVVTVFLSNDATAVVLTPAVLAAVRAAEAEPLPYLLICAFIANAASFVLPISNPANLVVYGGEMPPLTRWLRTFGLPAIFSILITFFVLRWLATEYLQGPLNADVDSDRLTAAGKLTLFCIGFLVVVLMIASALNLNLGAPACVTGLLVTAVISLRDHGAPKDLAKKVPWSVLVLVAGLFVIVEALNGAGALGLAVQALDEMKQWSPVTAALGSGFGLAVISNLMNNLPSGLIAGAAVKAAHATGPLRDAVLIGVDLGPNLSITGSLATILWLIAIRREGRQVSFWKFLKWGALVMPPALLLAIAITVLV
ncbi:MAG: arsenic transporter [Acidobacteriaceae bacterium]|nr:arsenic transporter [Acidobacteriaceae bacterium]MBV9497844.1 arsenic transporter [Acidobacteriaceae bacterium]